MKIKSVTRLTKDFHNEYVYDIQMNDSNQTFYANNILVHNSNYATYQEIKETSDYKCYEVFGLDSDSNEWIRINPVMLCKYDADKLISDTKQTYYKKYSDFKLKSSAKELILDIYRYRLAHYLDSKFEDFANARGTINKQNFELENISDHAIFLSKKKYIYNPVFDATNIKSNGDGTFTIDGIHTNSLGKIKAKGVELIQRSTPPFARKHLKNLLIYILDNSSNFNISNFIRLLRKLKEEFILTDIEDISSGVTVGKYHDYILNDSTAFEIASKAMMHVKSAGYYNFLLNTSANEFKKKYPLIRDGGKIKYYMTKSKDDKLKAFGYLPSSYPYEFAPQIDYDAQFEKAIIKPINRFVAALGYDKIDKALRIITKLF